MNLLGEQERRIEKLKEAVRDLCNASAMIVYAFRPECPGEHEQKLLDRWESVQGEAENMLVAP